MYLNLEASLDCFLPFRILSGNEWFDWMMMIGRKAKNDKRRVLGPCRKIGQTLTLQNRSNLNWFMDFIAWSVFSLFFHQVCAKDEVDSISFSDSSQGLLTSTSCSFRSYLTLSIHFFLCLPLLHGSCFCLFHFLFLGLLFQFFPLFFLFRLSKCRTFGNYAQGGSAPWPPSIRHWLQQGMTGQMPSQRKLPLAVALPCHKAARMLTLFAINCRTLVSDTKTIVRVLPSIKILGRVPSQVSVHQ